MSRDRKPVLAAIVVLAALTRLAVMVPGWSVEMADPDNYLPLARSLARGEGFILLGHPTAYRPPLYPLLLAPGVRLLGGHVAWWVRGLHVLLGAGTALLAARTARGWGMSTRQERIAALIVALDPVLVVQARSVMTETLAAFLLAAALAALSGNRLLGGRSNAGGHSTPVWPGLSAACPGMVTSRFRGTLRSAPATQTNQDVSVPIDLLSMVLGGLWLGLASLCRPSTLPAAMLIAMASMAAPGPWSRRLARPLLIATCVFLVLLPWALRNIRAVGEPVFTTTHGGYTLALANNPEYYREVLDAPSGAVWSGPGQRAWQVRISRETTGLPEPTADRLLRGEAVALARERPGAFARASLARLGRFWGLAPSDAVYPRWLRLATALWTVPLWLALGAGLWRRETWIWPRSSAPAILLALTAVHAFYWTDLRMRAPVVPAIALIAAAGIGGRRDADDGRPR